MKNEKSLDRIAAALEWRNYWLWHREQGGFSTLDEGTGPPPPPPPPVPPELGDG